MTPQEQPQDRSRPFQWLRRSSWLLLSLVLFVFVRPFIDEWYLGKSVIFVLQLATLLGAVISVMQHRRPLLIVSTLVGISIIARVLWLTAEAPGPLETTAMRAFLLFSFLTYAVVAALLAMGLFRTGRAVTVETLITAVSVYLLIGVAAAFAFALLESFVPASFTFSTEQNHDIARYERFLGFSFTTLTTLGYGNVSPASPRADALANLEAIIGQIYIAVVVARLVALQILHGSQRSTPSDDA